MARSYGRGAAKVAQGGAVSEAYGKCVVADKSVCSGFAPGGVGLDCGDCHRTRHRIAVSNDEEEMIDRMDEFKIKRLQGDIDRLKLKISGSQKTVASQEAMIAKWRSEYDAVQSSPGDNDLKLQMLQREMDSVTRVMAQLKEEIAADTARMNRAIQDLNRIAAKA